MDLSFLDGAMSVVVVVVAVAIRATRNGRRERNAGKTTHENGRSHAPEWEDASARDNNAITTFKELSK